MRLVADANILFSLARKDSVANGIVKRHKPKTITPSYAISELKKHRADIVRKSSFRNFSQIKAHLQTIVDFVDPKEFRGEIRAMCGAVSDSKDVIYVALAKKTGSIIWSNDVHLKEQKQVPVVNTTELLEILE